MDSEKSLQKQILALTPIQEQCAQLASYNEKVAYLSSLPQVKEFFLENKPLESDLQGLPAECQYVVKAVVALGQGPVIFSDWQKVQNRKTALMHLMDHLNVTNRFYDYMGGIMGYHVKTLELIDAQLRNAPDGDLATILEPPTTDVRTQNPLVNQLILDGIYAMPKMAEIYAVGGAGDRLKLADEKTGLPLPVARLELGGKTLLEGLVRDLEAREYLHYRLTGEQHVTPIVLMTSKDKKNDQEIAAILEEGGHFGRPKNSLFGIVQPMCPVLTVEGNWAVSGPYELVLKPGGHGVIWKLAEQYGAFDWLEKQKRQFCLVRQINNPLAGLDYNLLVLAGYGHAHKKAFGFESVPRLPNMSEGMNVLREIVEGPYVDCSISNLEYTEFSKKKQNDPEFAKIADSLNFPANTNILFANIDRVKKAVALLPVPGYLVNMKHPVDTLKNGQKATLPGARLESTMQNIADAITDRYKQPLKADDLQSLNTFVVLNDRAKTMSVTKKAFDGKALTETPEGCFYDLMQQNAKLLSDWCQFELPRLNSPEEYIKQGPNVIFVYHPALGPLYSIIGQRLVKGRLAHNAELQIEAAELFCKNLDVDGSLLIVAENVTGAKNSEGVLEFGAKQGQIELENVAVKNQGIDRGANNGYFKNRIQRKEALKIILKGHSKLIAKDVHFTGNLELTVPDGKLAIVTQDKRGKLQIAYEPMKEAAGSRYSIDQDNRIVLTGASE